MYLVHCTIFLLDLQADVFSRTKDNTLALTWFMRVKMIIWGSPILRKYTRGGYSKGKYLAQTDCDTFHPKPAKQWLETEGDSEHKRNRIDLAGQ